MSPALRIWPIFSERDINGFAQAQKYFIHYGQ